MKTLPYYTARDLDWGEPSAASRVQSPALSVRSYVGRCGFPEPLRANSGRHGNGQLESDEIVWLSRNGDRSHERIGLRHVVALAIAENCRPDLSKMTAPHYKRRLLISARVALC